MKSRNAFTLIELLIVVAIIAILAAIAVPNFLEAQVRAKVSRVKADMRSLATGIETYYIDYNSYPLSNNFSLPGRRTTEGDIDPDDRTLESISTPTAYMTSSFLPDPFSTNKVVSVTNVSQFGTAVPFDDSGYGIDPQYESILYASWDETSRVATPSSANAGFGESPRNSKSWMTYSGGPDRIKIAVGGLLALMTDPDDSVELKYDSTNGTISFGDIYRVGGAVQGDDAYGGNMHRGLLNIQD